MKKLLAIFMLFLLSITGFQFSETKAIANGWMGYVQNGALNTWISGNRSEGDYIDYDILVETYADLYKVTVPEKGVLTVKTNGTDSESGYCSYPYIAIYNGKTKKIYDRWFYYANYDGAYDIRYDSISLSSGTYYVEIYGGSKEYQLYIGYTPTVTQTRITNVKSYKKALKVYFDKGSGISGCQLQYATKKNMKNAKTIILKNNKKSKKITGLKKNKKYTMRIRTFKSINGKNYYSAWSKKVTKKTK